MSSALEGGSSDCSLDLDHFDLPDLGLLLPECTEGAHFPPLRHGHARLPLARPSTALAAAPLCASPACV